jgi:regulator of protease activity HflC (stomatin/prohibitin superfamily)
MVGEAGSEAREDSGSREEPGATESPEAGAARGAWEQAAERSFTFLFVVVCVLAVAWMFSNCRQVPPDSRAVVLRLGIVVRVEGSGLLLALPRPFEQVITLPSVDRLIAFPIYAFQSANSQSANSQSVNSDSAADLTGAATPISRDPAQNTAMLLTGDMSVVHFEARLLYRIIDARAYVLSATHVAAALERLFVASAVAVSASRDLDTILVARPDRNAFSDAARAGRDGLRADLQAAVNRRLADLAAQGAGLGIAVSRVDLVPSIPAEAKPAFDSVLYALQKAETATAEARTSAENTRQQANQDRDRILTDAQAMAEERSTLATTRTAAITALSAGAQGLSATMLSNQLYQEQVGKLFSRAGRVFATDGAGGSRLILPAGSRP